MSKHDVELPDLLAPGTHYKSPRHHSDTVTNSVNDWARGPAQPKTSDEVHGQQFDSSETDTDLAAELRTRIRGEVRFDPGSRALYATDASNYRQVPIGVVIPKDINDVVETVAAACRRGAPVLARGGGTSVAGQCCNVAVVIDFSKYMHRILALDPERKRARVEPGVVLDDLRDHAEEYHLKSRHR